ncbi:MAG: carboxypeptidase-like regulatory domain-containing protein [Sporichthyaceae bacterium]
MRIWIAGPFVLATVLCGACGSDGKAVRPAQPSLAPADSSLRGTVTAGPACAVQQAGAPCPDAPVGGAKVELVGTDGRVVLVTTTDVTGRFFTRAPAGTYTVRATNSGALASQAEKSVTLTARRPSTVSLVVDSGIR